MNIIKVIKVVDTRTYEEGPDDKWHPIPGSGNVRQCDRCGKDHEIHAEVELEDGTHRIVGTGCSNHPSINKEITKLARKAATSKINQLKAEKQKVLAEEYANAYALVEKMAPPAITESLRDDGIKVLHMGDVQVWINAHTVALNDHNTEYAIKGAKTSLLFSWKELQMKALGITYNHLVAYRNERKTS